VFHLRNFKIGDGSKPWYLVNPKIAGKWMFIPLKIVLIGIDPYPIHPETAETNGFRPHLHRARPTSHGFRTCFCRFGCKAGKPKKAGGG